MPTRVVIVRGRLATPWELRPWRELPDRFEPAYLHAAGNAFDPGELGIERIPVRTRRDLLPRGRPFDRAVALAGDRYLGLRDALAGADVVHAAELSSWFAAEAARHRRALGYRLVQTVWETIPLLDAHRNRGARANRRLVLEHTDLFLPATERARRALLVEGVDRRRIMLCEPGVDVERFAQASPSDSSPGGRHVILSPGRLVWEKGHQDVLRAVSALRRGLVDSPAAEPPRVVLVGRGGERERLLAHARELGIADLVEVRSVPYDEMPAVYAAASCMVLASLPHAGCELPPLSGRHRCFWEEQFGLVLAEGLAAGLPILASSSGAIPEVLDGAGTLFEPGDWAGLARALAAGPLSRPPGERADHPAELVRRYSTTAMAERLATAYDRVLSPGARAAPDGAPPAARPARRGP